MPTVTSCSAIPIEKNIYMSHCNKTLKFKTRPTIKFIFSWNSKLYYIIIITDVKTFSKKEKAHIGCLVNYDQFY